MAKIRLYSVSELIVYCLVTNYGTTTAKTKLKRCKFNMSVAKHQACFTTKLQGQNLCLMYSCLLTAFNNKRISINRQLVILL